jgi:CheY-like chemotaxis protein
MPYGKVLIVDDVYSNLYVAKGLMSPYGLSIDTVTSGAEAIGKVKAGELYDIIFMDHMMPKMDGVEATKIIRDLGYKNPIVVLTANAITGQAKYFLENGFDEFISKPIDIRQLNTILNNLIRNKQTPEVIAEANKQKNDLDSDQRSSLSKPDSVLQTVFLLDVKQSLPILEETLERIDVASEGDLRLFTINVHAMKSALANIGEVSASKRALALELAGKEQNRSFIKTHARSLIDSIRLIEARMQLENDNSASSDDIEEDTTFLREQLQVISNACAIYDERPVNAALEALKKLPWKKETRVLIDKIAEQLLYGDFDEAGKLAKG